MRWRRPQRPAQLSAGVRAPASRNRPPAGPAPSPGPGPPESCPCRRAAAARGQKGTILSRLPALPGGRRDFFFFFYILERLPTRGTCWASPQPGLGAPPGPRAGPDPSGHGASWHRRQRRRSILAGTCSRTERTAGGAAAASEIPSGGGDSSIAGFLFFLSPPPRLLLRLGPWCSPTGSPAPLSCETGCGEGPWILVCRLLVPTQVSLLSMEEDIDTRKINNSFLRDHSYATEGNAGPAAFRRWAREQVEDRGAPRAAGRVVAATPAGPGAGAGARLAGAATSALHIHPGAAGRARRSAAGGPGAHGS